MDEDLIKKFLRQPASDVIDLAVEMANLSWKEEKAVELCFRKRMTQERASEAIGISVDSMQRICRSAIQKLNIAWSGCWWIEYLAKKP